MLKAPKWVPFEEALAAAGDRQYEELPPVGLTERQRESVALLYEYGAKLERELSGWPVVGDFPEAQAFKAAIANFQAQFPKLVANAAAREK
jgi:hypothetical protein